MAFRNCALIVLAMMLMSGCSNRTNESTEQEYESAEIEIKSSNTTTEKETVICFDDTVVEISGESRGITLNNGSLEIVTAGTYRLKGSYTGKIIVSTTGSIRLVLDNFKGINDEGAALEITKADEVTLYLVEDTDNQLISYLDEEEILKMAQGIPQDSINEMNEENTNAFENESLPDYEHAVYSNATVLVDGEGRLDICGGLEVSFDKSFQIDCGEVVIFGEIDMLQGISSDSKKYVVMMTYAELQPPTVSYYLIDENGTNIISGKTYSPFRNLMISSDAFNLNDHFTLITNERESVSFTLMSGVTYLTENGVSNPMEMNTIGLSNKPLNEPEEIKPQKIVEE